MRHVSLITKIYGYLQHVLLHNCAISIDSCSPNNKFYSFITFSLLIKAVILQLNFLVLILYKFYSFIIFSLLINAVFLLLNCLVLLFYLYIHFLSLRCYFLYLNIIKRLLKRGQLLFSPPVFRQLPPHYHLP